MDILTVGLLVGSGYLLVEGSKIIFNKISKITRRWYEILEKCGLKKYIIHYKRKTERGYLLIVEVPKGGSIKQLEVKKNEIEKALSCKLEIIDIEFTKAIAVEIIKSN